MSVYGMKRTKRYRASALSASETPYRAGRRRRLALRLWTALEDEAFRVFYQPIYDLDGTLTACEALIRWPQADGTVVLPDAFVPFAEQTGLIVPLGSWVLRSACFQNAAWNRDGRALRVNVNVSGKQLADPDFVRTVRRALKDSALAPELLELELTESVMTTNVHRAAGVVEELREMGIRIAVDDFGTGYNSLVTLKWYVVDTLKLDMCFVTGIAKSPVDQAIASAVIAAAHGLGATVVAEGVEGVEQLATLRALECDAAQGYLFARPMPAASFTDVLRAEPRPRAPVRAEHRGLRHAG